MKPQIKKYLGVLWCFAPVVGLAQRIDNTAAYRQINSPKYARFHYDNDFFAARDLYYTQGYSFEVVHEVLRKNPLTKLLIAAKGQNTNYGLAFEHFGFTPTSISSDAILTEDRPFAACMVLKTFGISVDTAQRVRVSSVLSTGVIGPMALGGEMQTAIHRWINGVQPRGWQHQISNDLIVNYSLHYEKQLYAYRNAISWSVNTEVQAGTLNNRLQTGFTLMAGRFESAFVNAAQGRSLPFQMYVYAQPLMGLVAYDATLQGGFLNRSSPYVISPAQISRVTFQGNFGAVLRFKKLHLEYSQSVLTKEFKTGLPHRWGGFKIGFSF